MKAIIGDCKAPDKELSGARRRWRLLLLTRKGWGGDGGGRSSGSRSCGSIGRRIIRVEDWGWRWQPATSTTTSSSASTTTPSSPPPPSASTPPLWHAYIARSLLQEREWALECAVSNSDTWNSTDREPRSSRYSLTHEHSLRVHVNSLQSWRHRTSWLNLQFIHFFTHSIFL